MIIGVSSTKKTGKTTFINDFKNKWPVYTSPEKDYRSLNLALVNDGARDRTIDNPDLTAEERQRIILDFMLADVKSNYDRDKNIIHDHTTIDNLAYTIHLKQTKPDEISDDFVVESFAKVKESTHYYDIIVFIPIWGDYGDVAMEDIPKEIDLISRANIDDILKALYSAYHSNPDYKSDFWAKENAAVPVEVFGNREARLLMMETYLDENGGIRDETGATILDSLGRGISSKDIERFQLEPEPKIQDFV